MATKQDQLHPSQKKIYVYVKWFGISVVFMYIRNRTLLDTKFLFSCPNIFIILPSNIALDQLQGCALAVSGGSR